MIQPQQIFSYEKQHCINNMKNFDYIDEGSLPNRISQPQPQPMVTNFQLMPEEKNKLNFF